MPTNEACSRYFEPFLCRRRVAPSSTLRYSHVTFHRDVRQRQGDVMKAVRDTSVHLFLVLGLVIIMAGSALAASIYDFTLPSIDGKPMPLADFKGKVVLVVNVASRCGYTPQYTALESLYEKYKGQGFVIVG